MFEIIWTNKSLLQLDNLDNSISKRIFKKVEELKINPFSRDLKRLKKEKAFRLRVGDYRVAIDVDLKNSIIYVLRNGHRKNFYKR